MPRMTLKMQFKMSQLSAWVEKDSSPCPLSYTVNKSKNPGLTSNNIKNLSYQEVCDLINKNPVLVAKHFGNNLG